MTSRHFVSSWQPFAKLVSILYWNYRLLSSKGIYARLLFNLDRMLLFAKIFSFSASAFLHSSSFHFTTHQSCPCYLQLHSSLYNPLMEFFSHKKTNFLHIFVTGTMLSYVVWSENCSWRRESLLSRLAFFASTLKYEKYLNAQTVFLLNYSWSW